MRFEPCSPRCANWLRYGVQPKNARPGLVPGACKGKAHRREHLGYAGRRVLVSRKWSGKTLADHRADRKNWLTATLGLSATDPARYAWEPVTPGDPDYMEHARRLLHVVADRLAGKPRSMRREEGRVLSLRPIVRQPERRRDGRVVAIAAGGAYGTGTRMLTLDELCAWLNITERHARKLVERDAIPYRKVGHLLRFPEAEVEEWSHPSRRPMSRNSVSRKEPPRPPSRRNLASMQLPKSLIE